MSARAQRHTSPWTRGHATRLLIGWAGLAALAGLWQVLATARHSFVFPTFTSAVSAAARLVGSSVLTDDIVPSLMRVLVGFAISAVLGVVIGLALGYVRWLGDCCAAVVDFLRAVPTPLLIPAAVVIFGLGGNMVVAVIVSAAVWPVLVNAHDATRRVPQLYLDAARVCGLRGLALYRRVLLPATLPAIFAGLRVALSVSLAVLVVAEILGASSGIGFFIRNAQETFAVPQTYAGVIILACIGWLFDTAFLAFERRALAWERALGAQAGA